MQLPRIDLKPEGEQQAAKEKRTVTAAELLYDSELTQVQRWRIDELERAGYDPRAALTIATRHDVDLHRAVDLLRSGCSPELALRILL
jgi:hypothetical protein